MTPVWRYVIWFGVIIITLWWLFSWTRKRKCPAKVIICVISILSWCTPGKPEYWCLYKYLTFTSLREDEIFLWFHKSGKKSEKSNGLGVTGMAGKASEQSKKSHNQFRLRIFSFKDKTGDILDLWGKCHKRPFCCIEIWTCIHLLWMMGRF